jgi:hypothetical protein
MKSEAGDDRKMIAPIRSSGVPLLPMGIHAIFLDSSISGRGTLMGLSKAQGAMAFTWILYLAHTIANALVKFSNPPLEAS